MQIRSFLIIKGPVGGMGRAKKSEGRFRYMKSLSREAPLLGQSIKVPYYEKVTLTKIYHNMHEA